MKAYWGVEVQNHAFLTSALDLGEWSGQLHAPAALPPGTHRIGPRADMDAAKRKIPSPCRDSNPDHPARSPALYH
jgi:hypothetical protein